MLAYVDRFFNYVVDVMSNLSWTYLLDTYWYLFLIEVPRYYLLELVVVMWMGVVGRERAKDRRMAYYQLFKENPLVSVLVPGKNEGSHIYKLACSLREQTYRNVETIIVDDGSDDNTPIICRSLEKAGLITRYLRLRERGGKAAASNYGAMYARGKYIINLDADSSLDRDAIEQILLPFYLDPLVKAVGGCVKVRNGRDSLCSSMQALEYLKRIQVGRTVTSRLGIYHIISGAFGAFDRDVLRRVGYWDIGPGLDGDLTQKIRKAGFKVKFATRAVCMTSVPVKWYKLYHQRIRWSRSLVRFRIRKHRDILLPHRHFSILNWLSNFENILYDCVFNYLWAFYMLDLILSNTGGIVELFVVGFFLRFALAHIGFLLILLVSERHTSELYLYKYLPLMSLYTGFFLRMARLSAHTQELLFRRSYKDSWNPAKTSRYAELEHI